MTTPATFPWRPGASRDGFSDRGTVPGLDPWQRKAEKGRDRSRLHLISGTGLLNSNCSGYAQVAAAGNRRATWNGESHTQGHQRSTSARLTPRGSPPRREASMADCSFSPPRPVRVDGSLRVCLGAKRHDASGNLTPAASRPIVGQHAAPKRPHTRSDIRGDDGDVA